jgi:hypothetical protein
MNRLAFALAIALYVAHALRFDFLIDDAYITFRYARNLVEGYGLVYNPLGERVEGYSNPLWAWLLALGLKLGAQPESTSSLLGFASGLGVLILVRQACLRCLGGGPLVRWLSAVPVVHLAAHRSFAAWTTGGLETRMHSWLLLLALWLLDGEARRRALPGASLAAVAALLLVRADGFVQVALLAGGWLVWSRGRVDRRWGTLVASSAIVLAALTLFRFAYYGDPVPNTVRVKVPEPAISVGLEYLGWAVQDYGLFLLLPLALAAWQRWERGPFVPMALCTLLGQLAYVVCVGGDVFEFRLLDPIWPLAGTLAVIGVHRTVTRLQRPATRFGVVAAAVLALAWSVAPAFTGFEDRGRTASVENAAADCAVWARIGDWFREHAGPDEVIALRPAGVIPYRSRLPAFDMLGLNDRIIARRPPMRSEDMPGHRKVATWSDVLVRGQADYLLAQPEIHPRRDRQEPEGPTLVEGAGRRFALLPTWADLGDSWLRFHVVAEEVRTSDGARRFRVDTRIRPEHVDITASED